MIKLSDYLNYLNNEIIQARKKADEHAIQVAKDYASHEYLKYFKVPRYAFPSIKMDIPLKITDIDASSKYNFKLDTDKFLHYANERIDAVNKEKQLSIAPITKEQLQNSEFKQLFKTLEAKDRKPIKNIGDEIKKIDVLPQIKSLNAGTFRPQDATTLAEVAEMKRILTDAIGNNFSLVSTKINDIFIDPNTTTADDKDKLFINLHVEMEEEGLRLVTFTDKNGQQMEEIIFE